MLGTSFVNSNIVTVKGLSKNKYNLKLTKNISL